LRPDIDVGGVIAAYSVVTPKKILGGDYGLAFMVPVLNTRFSSNLFDASVESAGVSDIIKHKLAFDVHYEQQFGVELRTSGQILVFSITLLDLLPPPKPSK
jgi:hypothetical protein